MTILGANLKYLYWRKGILVMLFLILLFYLISIVHLITDSRSSFLSLGLWIFFVGLIFGGFQAEILSKPLCFCLPGHDKIPSKVLLVVAVLFTFLMFITHVLLLKSDILMRAALSIAISSAGLCIYWLGVWVSFRLRNSHGFIGFVGFMSFLMMMDKANAFCETVLADYWFLFVIIAVISTFAACRFLVSDNIRYKYCRQSRISIFDSWNTEKMQRFYKSKTAEKIPKKKTSQHLLGKLESFLLPKISDPDKGSVSRHVISLMYNIFGQYTCMGLIPTLKWMPLFIMFFGYTSTGAVVMCWVPAFAAINLDTGINSTLLIAGGRRERFYSALCLSVLVTMVVVLVIVLCCCISYLIEPLMPNITYAQQKLAYVPYSPVLAVLLLILMPVAISLGVLAPGKRYKFWFIIAMMVVMQITLVLTIMNGDKHINPGPTSYAVAGILSWLFLIASLKYVCNKRSLVSN